MTLPTPVQRRWKKPLLTIVWILTSGLFTALLLHPSVPGTVQSLLARPNRLLARTIEYGAHTAVFFVATQFALMCMEGNRRVRFVVILTAAAATAAIAELAQAWVPTRGVDPLDALCNLMGVALAGIAYQKLFQPDAVPSA